ncbi:MAG TPA: type II toxin-antitoxin system CcdA family antitoxin [Acidimicrobiales bacterium]|nr:type II toxin-antitoxin system CcdA family antitoxin [Acidimicrobiales bacterium]
MAKRKITVTVDEDVLETIRAQGDDNLSAAVNDALAEHARRIGRLAALRNMLDHWDAEFSPIPTVAATQARRSFDELDGIAEPDRGVA